MKSFNTSSTKQLCQFWRKIYHQIDRVKMRFLLGRTLANVFLCFLNRNLAQWMSWWIQTCIIQKIFILFPSPVHPQKSKTKNYLNSKHENIRFTCDKQHKNLMPFLDVLTTRTSNDFKTSVYHKPTFSGVY